MRLPTRHPLVGIWLLALAVGASGWLHAANEAPPSSRTLPALEKPARILPAINAPVGSRTIDFFPVENPAKTWAMTNRDFYLHPEPAETSEDPDVLPAKSAVKLLRTQGEWAQLAYGGQRGLQSPFVAWARHVDLEPLPARPRWAKTFETAKLWPSPEGETPTVANVGRWTWLELTGEEKKGRVEVRVPGDGQNVPPGRGWIDAASIVPVQSPSAAELPRGYPANAEPGAQRLAIPYRTQLDGSPWEGANCGPTALAMGLAYLGKSSSSAQVRRSVLNAQNIWGDDAGVYIWALASSAERYGVRALDLYLDGVQHTWTTDDVRYHVERGRPVILQVAYRALPGRENALYGGDHYVIVTGIVPDGFLYNDPVDSDGIGFDRHMTVAQLGQAMRATDRRYANAGFALTRS